MKKILITGATGHLGSSTVRFLKEKVSTDQIAVLVRNTDNDIVKSYKSEGIEIRVGDYDNFESLKEAFKGIDLLYFVSGSDIGKRLPQHKNVVKAAEQAGVEHILYTSTVRNDESEVAPLFPVVDSHKQTEDLILASGLTYTILRHNLYAEVINMFIGDKAQVLQTKSIYLPTEDGVVSFVPRKDFAEAEAIILANPEAYKNVILEFNGSEQVGFKEVAEKLSAVVGETIPYISPEEGEFRKQLAEVGIPQEIIDMVVMFSLGIANGEFNHKTNDLEKVLGRPTQSIADFLKETYA